jgi:hypothetical protein
LVPKHGIAPPLFLQGVPEPKAGKIACIWTSWSRI